MNIRINIKVDVRVTRDDSDIDAPYILSMRELGNTLYISKRVYSFADVLNKAEEMVSKLAHDRLEQYDDSPRNN